MLAKVFSSKEYLYWIIATISALVANIILLINTKSQNLALKQLKEH
jgi:hypothetical protein